MVYYLDTSAFLKLIVAEKHSKALRAWADRVGRSDCPRRRFHRDRHPALCGRRHPHLEVVGSPRQRIQPTHIREASEIRILRIDGASVLDGKRCEVRIGNEIPATTS